MTTATAQSHPNIAFIKYWGNRDNELRIPSNSSISMNLDGLFTRTREYGTLGLAQTLKQLRDSGHKFPIYENQSAAKGGFDQLGKLQFHHINNS